MTATYLILDHGYVKHIESWGSDQSIIEAARMSTDKGFLGWEPIVCEKCGGLGDDNVTYKFHSCTACNGTGRIGGDEKLLRYLYENKHHTPFEMAGLIIEVQAPIFVFREWHRHRTQSYNEMRARYVPLPDVNYIPTIERLMLNVDRLAISLCLVDECPSCDGGKRRSCHPIGMPSCP